MGAPIAPHDLASLEAQVRSAVGDAIVLLDSTLPPVKLAAMRAAIGPLAVECAPARRINAVVTSGRVDAEDLSAAIRWLSAAASTTGQVLELSSRA
jgi:uncharacterized heparinase superfamily protein